MSPSVYNNLPQLQRLPSDQRDDISSQLKKKKKGLAKLSMADHYPDQITN